MNNLWIIAFSLCGALATPITNDENQELDIAQIRTDDCGVKLQALNFAKLAWRTLDKTGDKKLSFDEIVPIMSALLWPNKFTKEMFDAMDAMDGKDTRKDGVLGIKGLRKGVVKLTCPNLPETNCVS